MNSYTHYSLVFFAIHLFPFWISSQPDSPRNPMSSHYHTESQASPPYSNASPVFNVLSYGAAGDGRSDDTYAFKKCWDDACKADVDSAVFLVPKNGSFVIQYMEFSGPCRNQLVFQVQGRIVAPDGPSRWLASKRLYWLVFAGIDGMTMEGGGIVDGKGRRWWDLPCKPHKGPNKTTLPGPCDSPIAIVFIACSNLQVQNLNITNSPLFHFWFERCSNILIDSLNIKSAPTSPNTDGIHLHNTYNVMIYNTIVTNGDDCVSIGGGCYNVDMRNLTCGPGHGISIGSLGKQNSKECVSNITVRDSIIKRSDNGLRIKTWQGGSGSVSRVTFDGIRMYMVRNPIIISQYYCDSKYTCPNQTSSVYITDVVYRNIKGTYDAMTPPVYFACSDKVPCTDLELDNVRLIPAVGQKKFDPFCWNAHGHAQDTNPAVNCLSDGGSLPIDWCL